MTDLHEVNAQGMSPESIAAETDLDRRTVELHLGRGTMTLHVRKKLIPVTRRIRRTLVSGVANIILENYREHKDKLLYPDTTYLLRFIHDHLEIVPRLQRGADAYEKRELDYVLAHLLYSLAFHFKSNALVDGVTCNNAAVRAHAIYTTTALDVQAFDPTTLTEQQAAHQQAFAQLLELNALEIRWQMARRGLLLKKGSLTELAESDPVAILRARKACLEELAAQDILGRLRSALTIPQNAGVWQIPHTGLIFASLLNNRDDMEFFHAKLVEVQPGFRSWDFTPGETETLGKDSDLENFRKAFPH